MTPMNTQRIRMNLALRDEIGLARFVDQLRDFVHRAMHGHVPQPHENHHPERQSEDAHDETRHEQRAAVDALELHQTEIRQHQIRFAAGCVRGWRRLTGLRRLSGGGTRRQRHQQQHGSRQHCEMGQTRTKLSNIALLELGVRCLFFNWRSNLPEKSRF